ncbi:MAG TPA: response regulator transcription factor [Flexilinea sp.]|jgi:two-component system alkaline phosphatase synthesis response regulator PhoP|nr:response regulator transcription factor [Flexilinea sp.]HOG22676.1 response regulator transcription factor [Flexilinea sp.]HOG61379.1 response regulator transcription factor [Flexilinea sp.]HOP02288.1 response regulator transcription factor [Flexilinea sp.]HOU20059.1 response regulator transcription factor [Flexilinea sp.]
MIYCVEDNTEIRELVVYTLQMTGFTARGFVDGKDFFAAIKEELPELVLLDIMLPGEDGLQILKKLRASEVTRAIPVIMLTAKTTEYDKVIGLDSGADDYLTKPFGMMELIARIKAVLRRASVAEESDEITIGPLVVYRDEHRVFNNGVEVALTPKEFSLLLYLIENRGIVLTRERLLSEVWGFDYYGETRTVDAHIRSLRMKLGEAGDLIETVRGIGYRIEKL